MPRIFAESASRRKEIARQLQLVRVPMFAVCVPALIPEYYAGEMDICLIRLPTRVCVLHNTGALTPTV